VAATNTELEKLSLVTEDVAKVSANATVVSENAAQMTSLFTVTLGGPLVKTAALGYGIRKALRGEGPAGDVGVPHDPALLLVRPGRRGGHLRFVKIRDALRRATPQAVGQRVADQAAGLGASARDFTDRVRAAMAEREAEIRTELGLPE
jgi:hypothetical protein